MLYENINTLQLYNSQRFIPLPKGDSRTGFGNVVFLLSSSTIRSREILSNEFFAYYQSMYSKYYVDFRYNEKIGKKKIVLNNAAIVKKEFKDTKFPHLLTMVQPAVKKDILTSLPNLIVDLGEWNKLYFSNMQKISQASICSSYLSFISSKINDTIFNDYNKVLYIDLNDWFIENSAIFGMNKNLLDNPLSILLLSIYKYGDLIKQLGIVDIVIGDSKNSQFMKLHYTDLVKESFNKIKSKLTSMSGIKDKVSPNIDKDITTISENDDNEIVSKLLSENEKSVINSRNIIINSLKKRLMGGNSDDITGEYIKDEDKDDNELIEIDSVYNDEIDKVAHDYINNNPDILTAEPDVAAEEIEKEIINKVYISKFMPERSDKEIARINELYSIHKDIVGTPSYQDLESKIIDTTDLSHTLTTSNFDITTSKFRNFDNNYNKKKLGRDIDEAVGSLANATHKIFVTDKEEEDTSDQLNLKKTLTYRLQDEKGRRMTVRLDVPILIDDKYVYLNGNKKILQHQLIFKPLVKTGPDTVQVVAWYNKLFIERKNKEDLKSSSLRKYLVKNVAKYNVILGNATIKNNDIETPIEFDIIASRIYEFTINGNIFITDIKELYKKLDSLKINYKRYDLNNILILGYNEVSKELIFMDKRNDVYYDIMCKYIPCDDVDSLKKMSVSRLMYSQCTIQQKSIPLVLFLLYCEGFKSVMEKANIEHSFVTRAEAKKYDNSEYGKIELSDGIVVWKRYPLQNSLLLNGMLNLPTNLYAYEELESKDTYIFMLSQFYAYANVAFIFDQFKDFMIDHVTKEILIDFNLPTDLVGLLLVANNMLKDNTYLTENSGKNLRVRSNELIPYFVYKAITNAYGRYRKTQHKAKPTPISLKGTEVLVEIKKSQLTEESSVLNPVLELEKNRAVTYRGKTGINLDQAMSLETRSYDETMVGILGISTSDDANTGIVRQLSLEPKITSTRGYIEVTPKEDIDKLNSANLMTPSEFMTPFSLRHDDPCRISMVSKQVKQMMNVKDSSPVLIGNRVESIIPYHLSREFCVVAKEDGIVENIENNFVIIKYKNGEYDSVDLSSQIKKNSSSGFYVENKFICDKKIGDKIKKDEVLAYNKGSFTKSLFDDSISMTQGVLTKIAVIPNWDIYEDSAPITEKLSHQMAVEMIADKEIALDKGTFVQSIVKVGDKINVGDSLIVFDSFPDDPDAAKFLADLRDDLKEEIIESSINSVKSKYTGDIIDIKIYTTVDVEELSESLQKLVNLHHDNLRKKEDTLEKYRNSSDYNYYKCGQLISESTNKLTADYQGKIKGATVNEGVLIVFYIKYTDIMSTGDKGVSQAALKSIKSHVIDAGYEPYSEFQPDEEISTIVSPLSISARKTPSIFYNMFGNKLLIYLKRQLKEKYVGK